MIASFLSFFTWMPPIMQVIVGGVVSIFVVVSFVKLINLIIDLIPFN